MNERLAAEEKAKKMAAEKASRRYTPSQKQAYQTAQALNSFEVAVVGLRSAFEYGRCGAWVSYWQYKTIQVSE